MLRVDDLTKDFGGLRAVDHCSFQVEARTITGLIGPNGSGKSTIFNLVSGFYRPDGGRVAFKGEPLNGLEPHEIATRGLARTFQLTRVFPTMTVMENMLLAARGQRGERLWAGLLCPPIVRRQERGNAERARGLLALLELDLLRDEYAGNLSYGQQKLVELARALMADPDLILLDEPMAGVNPTLINKIATYIETLQGQGRAFLIVEHDMRVVMSVCQRIIVLNYGRIIADGPPSAIARDPAVLEAYLGK